MRGVDSVVKNNSYKSKSIERKNSMLTIQKVLLSRNGSVMTKNTNPVEPAFLTDNTVILNQSGSDPELRFQKVLREKAERKMRKLMR